MKKCLFALFIVLPSLSLKAQTGLTCNDPIPVDSNYVGYVGGPCTLWYTAYTYDLPLNVHFIPDADNSSASPEIEVDFSCVSGKYDDPLLDSLLTTVEDFGLSFPLEFRGNLITPTNKNEWELSINESYREHLAEYGITYNLQAFVKVTYYESGSVRFKPDTSFIHCVENTPYVNLGDTLEVIADDVETAYVFPFTDWQNDSIQFVWNGDQGARIYLAVTDCEFVVEENNGFIWTQYDVISGTPKKLYSSQMKDAIKNNKSGGLYYAKIVSPSSGQLIVENIPMAPIHGGAILIEKDKPIHLAAGDTSTLYCFPKTWKGTYFTSSSPNEIKMYTSPSYDFGIAQSNGAWRRIFTFDVENMHRTAYASNSEMQLITEKAIDDYIYVRFVCDTKTIIVASDWEQSVCVGKSTLIRPNASFSVQARSSNNVYRLKYSDWEGYDITIKWGGSVSLPVYIADACEYTLSANNGHVLQYKSISRKGTFNILATTVNSWASRVDEDGFLYVRFNPTNQGSVTFSTKKPIPVIPTDPCVINSIEIKAGDQLTLNLDSAFTIYRIEYAVWKDKGISLSWTGTTDLHTFVAETCTFAVAPYNKYVHVYVPVQGEHTLDAAAMADLAEYVDENGYLYVRFLTEKEGVLTVE